MPSGRIQQVPVEISLLFKALKAPAQLIDSSANTFEVLIPRRTSLKLPTGGTTAYQYDAPGDDEDQRDDELECAQCRSSHSG